MHAQVLITFSLVSHALRTKNKYVHLFCAAGFFRFLQKACGFFCQRNASVNLIDVMLVQSNVLQQDSRIPAPLECYIKCPTTLNFLNNKFPPLENIRTSKCPNYARGGGCYTFVLIGALGKCVLLDRLTLVFRFVNT